MEPASGSIREITSGKGELCREIHFDLPEWFGIPAAIDDYVRAVEDLPMFSEMSDGATTGFLSIKPHTAFAAEAYVLGVRRAWHRRGIGRRLFAHVEAHLRERGFVFLTVKTLSAEHPSAAYAATRRFYQAI